MRRLKYPLKLSTRKSGGMLKIVDQRSALVCMVHDYLVAIRILTALNKAKKCD